MKAIYIGCSVDGCNSDHLAKGFCSKHYLRYKRHGDPLANPSNRGEPLTWLQKNRSHQGQECLEWPFGHKSAGYGSVLYRGKIMGAHRAMCFEAHGDPLSANMEAAHSCGNGHLGCVNPRHLRWATPVDNYKDRLAHGRNRRLSDEQCAEIVDLARTVPQARLAERFGVSASFVCRLVSGDRRPLAISAKQV